MAKSFLSEGSFKYLMLDGFKWNRYFEKGSEFKNMRVEYSIKAGEKKMCKQPNVIKISDALPLKTFDKIPCF